MSHKSVQAILRWGEKMDDADVAYCLGLPTPQLAWVEELFQVRSHKAGLQKGTGVVDGEADDDDPFYQGIQDALGRMCSCLRNKWNLQRMGDRAIAKAPSAVPSRPWASFGP